MRQVFKYQPDIAMHEPFFQLELPQGAVFLKVAMQHDRLTFWFEVDSNNTMQQRSFAVVPTGMYVPKHMDGPVEFLETVFQGIYVWHIYEVVEVEA